MELAYSFQQNVYKSYELWYGAAVPLVAAAVVLTLWLLRKRYPLPKHRKPNFAARMMVSIVSAPYLMKTLIYVLTYWQVQANYEQGDYRVVEGDVSGFVNELMHDMEVRVGEQTLRVPRTGYATPYLKYRDPFEEGVHIRAYCDEYGYVFMLWKGDGELEAP